MTSIEPNREPKNYRLLYKLGSGTYATVYKAQKRDPTRSEVAVKVIERSRLNRTSMQNLITEIEVMKDLGHPHIVKLLDFEWDDSCIYLVMEFCAGGDLSNFIRSKKTLSEAVARKFLRQLALALQFMRSKGIAHMDLKPQNLLLTDTRKPVLKIGDFGMAQHLSAEDSASSFRGSPLYMAPEIMLSQHYDAKVDLWSVGVILYEALFGAAPYACATLEELHVRVLDPRPVEIPSLPAVTEQCRHLLQCLLERDPDKRITFEDFFNHPFVDLEHLPSAECLPKARNLLQLAVVKDYEGKVSAALNLYCSALDYLLPARKFETDPDVQADLSSKIEQYIARAEVLKSQLKEYRPVMSKARLPVVKLMASLEVKHPQILAATNKAREADALEALQDYPGAFELYKAAVSILIPLIDVATTPEEKKLIKSEAEVYLNRAEEVKLIMQTANSMKFQHRPSSGGDGIGSTTSQESNKCKLS